MARASWDDLRMAYQVAVTGSLSKVGKHLGVNHATVLRHVNALEDALKIKLFLRHQRGYQLTAAGRLLLDEMPEIEQRLNHLEHLLKNEEKHMRGPLLITTVNDYMPRLSAAMKAFRDSYPEIQLQIIATDEILSLASGVAHVSLRMGQKPNDPDIIVRPLTSFLVSYYAADSYVSKFGIPNSREEYNNHFWVMPSGGKQNIPFIQKMLVDIDSSRLVYQSNSFLDIQAVVVEGMGIGPMPVDAAARQPHLHKLKCVESWGGDSAWFTYHRDMKQNAKVQALYSCLEQELSRSEIQPT